MTDATCSIGGCTLPLKVISRRMCSMHHTRFLRGGDPGETGSRRTKNMGAECQEEACASPAARRGRCRKHYRILILSERAACAVEGCLKPWEQSGLCGMHYWRGSQGDVGGPDYRIQRYGDEQCSVRGCSSRAATQWMCRLHYGYLLRTGRQPSVFTNCLTCRTQIDLRESGTPGVLLSHRPRLCRDCLRMRPNGRWCLTTTELADRDGLNCSICCVHVDLTVAWPDPLSPSVDHRIPRALGGLDEPSNVALAHLRCNISKGIRATA